MLVLALILASQDEDFVRLIGMDSASVEDSAQQLDSIPSVQHASAV